MLKISKDNGIGRVFEKRAKRTEVPRIYIILK
jgi:hypothetical protein